jgi:hypothetical protein
LFVYGVSQSVESGKINKFSFLSGKMVFLVKFWPFFAKNSEERADWKVNVNFQERKSSAFIFSYADLIIRQWWQGARPGMENGTKHLL